MTPKKPRVSLTKTQLQAAVGAELLALCQSVTADGVLTNEEVGELRAWLEANRSQDLPAIESVEPGHASASTHRSHGIPAESSGRRRGVPVPIQ